MGSTVLQYCTRVTMSKVKGVLKNAEKYTENIELVMLIVIITK